MVKTFSQVLKCTSVLWKTTDNYTSTFVINSVKSKENNINQEVVLLLIEELRLVNKLSKIIDNKGFSYKQSQYRQVCNSQKKKLWHRVILKDVSLTRTNISWISIFLKKKTVAFSVCFTLGKLCILGSVFQLGFTPCKAEQPLRGLE